MYYVYELVNLMGTVEYVGFSKDTNRRFYQHIKNKPGVGKGTFYRRQDLILNIVESFCDKKEALEFENLLQSYWGLITDKQKCSLGKKGKQFTPEHKKNISFGRTGVSKLSSIQKNEIRKLYSTNLYSQRKLATMFGVVQSTIRQILISS